VKHVVALVLASAATIGTVVAVGACKQQEGERCQIDGDCESPLVCNGEGFCSSSAMLGVDALPPPDAPDAAVDAAVDAPPDAP
jgi:hypothetical protein